MKFLLTSAGISNESIENELRALIGKDFKELKMLFCNTASNYEGGEMNDQLIDDLEKLKRLGFKIDVCDINGVSKDNFLPRFEWADVFYFEDGKKSYIVDNNGAVSVDNESIKIVSEGKSYEIVL